MQRKSLALVAIGFTLLSIFLLQMTVAQAAAPQQAAPTATDEPQPLQQPIRIKIRQAIPFTITVQPAAEITATSALTEGEAAIAATENVTASAALTETTAVTESVPLTEEAGVEAPTVTNQLTATEAISVPALASSVPVTLTIDLDFVVTQTLTTTVPASVTVQLSDVETQTLPIEVLVAPLADGEAMVELVLPPVEEPAAAPEITETAAATPTAEITETVAATPTETAAITPTVAATLAPEINGVPLINTTIAVTANLRSGPGTNFDIVAQGDPGQPVQIAAISEDGQWYLLATGAWIANFLLTEQPTNAPTVNDQILQAIQGVTPSPTPAVEATPEAPAATGVVTPTVTVDANLRAGPGTEFEILGGTITGQEINIVGRNADGTWFRLDNGGWVLGTLIANPPALDTVPVVNNDGTSVEAPAAPTATPAPAAGALSGLLPTPTPQAQPQAGAETAALATYLASASELVGQFDVVLNSVDALVAEANNNNALLSDTAWVTRMNAAITLLRRTSASVGELTVPAGAEELQQLLETAAISYNEAADALNQAVQAADITQFNAADSLVSTATANLTAAETAIIEAQGQ